MKKVRVSLVPLILFMVAAATPSSAQVATPAASPTTTGSPQPAKAANPPPQAIAAPRIPASALRVGPSDLRIEQHGDSGYHLYIRKKADISSILLTETTKDPLGKTDNFAYRALERNDVNGDETRILDGKEIPKEKKLWSLVSSHPEKDAVFGEAFHIFIPWVVAWGYPWSRSGETYVQDGTFINIRAFNLAKADYRGSWVDNPFQVKVTQRPKIDIPAGAYSKAAAAEFAKLAESGTLLYSPGAKDVVPRVKKLLETAKGEEIDLVVCVDTTESMEDDIDSIRKTLVPMIAETLKDSPRFRLGIVFYKDYFEEYLTKELPFSLTLDQVQRQLDAVRAWGGRDEPEAVDEALWSSLVNFDWASKKRMIILIGDAPPHPFAQGKITGDIVKAEAKKRGVTINAIIIPQ